MPPDACEAPAHRAGSRQEAFCAGGLRAALRSQSPIAEGEHRKAPWIPAPVRIPKTKNYPSVTGIGRDEHVGMVREIFTSIPGRYDFLNHLLSLRRDVAWRRFAVRKMQFFDTYRLLDVATGTADLAIDAARRHPDIRVTGVDFVREMLARGRQKIASRGLADRIRLLQADAMALPFPDGSFDAVGIAFGIRNMPDRLRALREMRRVLVPGGRIFVLEMNAPQNRLWRGFFAPYLNRILPVIARRFSRNPAAYSTWSIRSPISPRRRRFLP